VVFSRQRQDRCLRPTSSIVKSPAVQSHKNLRVKGQVYTFHKKAQIRYVPGQTVTVAHQLWGFDVSVPGFAHDVLPSILDTTYIAIENLEGVNR